jgi:hypothetical protein
MATCALSFSSSVAVVQDSVLNRISLAYSSIVLVYIFFLYKVKFTQNVLMAIFQQKYRYKLLLFLQIYLFW